MFDEVGRAAMGTWGSGMVYGTIYLTILCEPIIFHLTCMETLRQVRRQILLLLLLYGSGQASTPILGASKARICQAEILSCCNFMAAAVCCSTLCRDVVHVLYCVVLLMLLCCCVVAPQTFYMFNLSQTSAFWIVTALILPLSQVSSKSGRQGCTP